MTSHISDSLLHQLSDFVAARLGLHFPKERRRDLARGIGSAAREFDFADAESCAKWLLSSSLTKSQIEILASHLTIGETYFFREMGSLGILRDRILPELIRSRREGDKHLRIWSAACSTGEEPYTLAILLDRLLPDIGEWRITVNATDINPRALEKASAGVYGEWSFRSTPLWVRQKYFVRKDGNRFEISSRIREMVTFSYLNLVEDAYPSLLNNTNGMDVILCRNALMYFTPSQASKVIRHFNLSLVEGGWLVVSPVDASQVHASHFAPVSFPDATLYQKNGRRTRVTEVLACGPEHEPAAASPTPPVSLPVPEPLIAPPTERGEHLSSDVDEQTSPYAEALDLYGQGRYGEAADKVSGLVSLGRGDSGAFALLARAHANQGHIAEALAWCEKAVAADKTNPSLHYLLATILQEQGQSAEAAASLRRALYLDHNFVLAHFALGNLTRQRGRAEESEKHFQNALSLLEARDREEVLPESEGITAGRLTEIISSMTNRRRLA